ncbi:hypothetical protein CEXT_122241, partial [Caerostris extrusa]
HALWFQHLVPEYIVHDYDVQIHPTHGHHGYGHGLRGSRICNQHSLRQTGTITKYPTTAIMSDIVYQYVSDETPFPG